MGQSGGRWAQGAVREVPALLRSWKRRDGERMLGDMGASLTRPRRGELQDEEVAALLSAFLESRAVVGEASEATGGFLTLLALANGDLTLRVGGVNVVPSFVKLCAQWLSCHYHAASKGDNLDGRYLAALQVMHTAPPVAFRAAAATEKLTAATPAVHGLASADPVRVTTRGALPTGLSQGADYWAGRIDGASFALHTSAPMPYAAALDNVVTVAAGHGLAMGQAVRLYSWVACRCRARTKRRGCSRRSRFRWWNRGRASRLSAALALALALALAMVAALALARRCCPPPAGW